MLLHKLLFVKEKTTLQCWTGSVTKPDQSWQNSGNVSQFSLPNLARTDSIVTMYHSFHYQTWPELTEKWQCITVFTTRPGQSWQHSGNVSQFSLPNLAIADSIVAMHQSFHYQTWPELTEQWQSVTVCIHPDQSWQWQSITVCTHPDQSWQNSGNHSLFASTLTRADRTVAICQFSLPSLPGRVAVVADSVVAKVSGGVTV